LKKLRDTIELTRYIMEQDAAGLRRFTTRHLMLLREMSHPAAPDAAAPVADPTLGATAPAEPEVIDTTTDTEVEKIDSDWKVVKSRVKSSE
jgi:hypothetical protein